MHPRGTSKCSCPIWIKPTLVPMYRRMLEISWMNSRAPRTNLDSRSRPLFMIKLGRLNKWTMRLINLRINLHNRRRNYPLRPSRSSSCRICSRIWRIKWYQEEQHSSRRNRKQSENRGSFNSNSKNRKRKNSNSSNKRWRRRRRNYSMRMNTTIYRRRLRSRRRSLRLWERGIRVHCRRSRMWRESSLGIRKSYWRQLETSRQI